MMDAINSQYSKAVGATSKKIVSTLTNFYHRDYATVECQTLSFEEFEKQFNDKIDALESMLKNKTEERKIVEGDIKRMKNQLEIISLERAQKA